MNNTIKNNLKTAIKLKKQLLEDDELLSKISKVAQLIIETYKREGKVLFCGNGGSAADAQHLAAELSGRYYIDRKPLNAEALHVNSSFLTAVANDYGYEEVYSRLIQGIGNKGDVLIALSTSGNSENILRAIDTANTQQLTTIGLTGKEGGSMKSKCQILINIPTNDTPRIQEAHMLIGHTICEMVEASLFSSK
ncbi:MAG: D-sedoheptulose 7-phosphate isomerase [Saprospiraceae bacterium]